MYVLHMSVCLSVLCPGAGGEQGAGHEPGDLQAAGGDRTHPRHTEASRHLGRLCQYVHYHIFSVMKFSVELDIADMMILYAKIAHI